ncbi:hypothetical protein AYWB_247 [Aster yellows witches'-broom phytoplasma AYWB]|uniref:Uncharacterized protein n=1 Tax=Aster yellows witches'-broom phytoplasma (strain AYWB) TaxID=322098 RepID=Q2NJM9_AYWBP|nr:hypothetical protein AYWB_247 [Aster yellows witches'-broom phytoplasma AYWB]
MHNVKINQNSLLLRYTLMKKYKYYYKYILKIITFKRMKKINFFNIKNVNKTHS